MEIIVDNFAGGGGASTGIEAALGRPIDIAINHDKVAIAMHRANHPHTKHLFESVWDVDPIKECAGRPVGLAWFSPDCKHFSKAKGGKPVEKKIRGLAWVALRWASTVRPRVIMLENVEEFLTWGPVIEKDGKHFPDPARKGQTFNVFVRALEKHGYKVEHRLLLACDYGAPTIRKRLFMIARCDGQPVIWPKPTHGDPKSEAVKSGNIKPWRTAAECIDWSIPAPSIFERKKPLAEATQRRIAKGIMKYVVNAANPFIVTYYGLRPGDEFRGQPLDEPLRTQTAGGNKHALVIPFLSSVAYSKTTGRGKYVYHPEEPVRTLTSTGDKVLFCAEFARHMGKSIGQDLRVPFRTAMTGSKDALVTSHIVKLKGTNIGQDEREPLHTITAGGLHFGEVRAFLIKYFGTGENIPHCKDPLPTVTGKDRFGLVTVHGEEYALMDIGMRMLTPRELFRAQGFPDSYIIEHDADGKPITKTEQVAKCGNSVCPDMARALVSANAGHAVHSREAQA